MPMTNGGGAGPRQQELPPIGVLSQHARGLTVLSQYVKDFSFENPNAPASLRGEGQHAMQFEINVDVAQQGESDYEVTLKLEGKAERTGSVMFAFHLSFAGLVRIQNVPQEVIQQMLTIEAPRFLYPFARDIVTTAVHNAGFEPLVLNPVNFGALYQQRKAAQSGGQPIAPGNA